MSQSINHILTASATVDRMLSSLIQHPSLSNPEVEDVFFSALNVISPDDVSVMHGDPGSSVVYKSQRYGDLELRLAEPQTEDERKLFGHYLWNAGVLLAEYIGGMDAEKNCAVKNERVLELGAGERNPAPWLQGFVRELTLNRNRVSRHRQCTGGS